MVFYSFISVTKEHSDEGKVPEENESKRPKKNSMNDSHFIGCTYAKVNNTS